MSLKLSGTHSYIYIHASCLTTALLKKLDATLSFLVAGVYFAKKRRPGWDGRRRLLTKVFEGRNFWGYKFPAGLIPFAEKVLGDIEIDWRPVPTPSKVFDDEAIQSCLVNIKLRKYQVWAVKTMLEKKRGVLDFAVGSGKTEIAAAVMRLLDIPSVFLVPTLDLLYQTRTRLAKRFGCPIDDIGMVGDTEFVVKKITVAMVPTLRTMLNSRGRICNPKGVALFRDTQLVFSDEAHMVADNSFYSVFMAFSNAEYRFGLSGTPFDRADKEDLMLIGATGPTIARIVPEFLMRIGILSVPEIVINLVKYPPVHYKASYPETYKIAITENDYRNNLIVDNVEKHKGEKILVVFKNIAHGKMLSAMLNDRDIKHRLVYGEVSGEEREQIRNEFENGELDVIVGSMVFKLGVDLPSIKVLIRADGGESTISTIQILGRALRVKDEDRKVYVVDFYDDTSKYLRAHSKHRIKDYYGVIGKVGTLQQIDPESGQQFLFS